MNTDPLDTLLLQDVGMSIPQAGWDVKRFFGAPNFRIRPYGVRSFRLPDAEH